MEFLNTWLQTIIVSVIIATIVEMILPSGNNKKYIKVVLGIYVVFNIITPVINKITNDGFEISSIINIDEYSKKMEEYKIDTLDESSITAKNNNSIEQIYILNLEKDMKAKLEEKGYKVDKIEIFLQGNEEYLIEKVELYIEKENNKEESIDNKTSDITKDIDQIKEVEKVNIQIQNNNQLEETKNVENKNLNNKNSITEKEKQEIKEYIASIYEAKEILIY